MRPINCIVVDDEPLARNILETYIDRIPGFLNIHSCMNAIEAYETLQQERIDLMFLDIRMPVISGLDFLRSLKQPPLVVFTTAYGEHAIEGFELDAIDYLMKPVTFERFIQAADKARRWIELNKTADVNRVQPAEYSFIKHDNKLVKINYADILFLEAHRDFTMVYLKERKLLISMHLKALEEVLANRSILRIHRSYMVNLDAIKSINGNIIEIEDKQVPIGTSYKDELFRRLGWKL